MAKKKNVFKAVEQAVENVREAIHSACRNLRDAEYLEFLDIIGSDIDGMIDAKKEEDSEEDE